MDRTTRMPPRMRIDDTTDPPTLIVEVQVPIEFITFTFVIDSDERIDDEDNK